MPGKCGLLVQYFLSHGVKAFGIERLTEIEHENIEECDWLEYAFGKRRWGTVMSNNAFSNHFRYVGGRMRRAADRYLPAEVS